MDITPGSRIDISSGAIKALPTLDDLGMGSEILEAAEAIVDASDVAGVERHRPEVLLRVVLSADRENRSKPCGDRRA